jgi:glyoxylase-like metal-dependent hydrolase (beta-lactamase superfamily II)
VYALSCYHKDKMKTSLEEIAQETYRLEAQIPGLNTVFSVFFIRDKDSVLIEPGPAANIPAIQKAVKELALDNLEYVIPTHIHLDHAGALGSLLQLFPQARGIVNPGAVEHVIDPSRLIKSTKMAFGEDFEALYGQIIPVPHSRLKVVQDNDSIDIGSRQLQFIHTPGHAPHHIAIFDTKTKGIFCGEALGLIYSPGAPPLPAVAPPSFDPDIYLNNMLQLKKLHPKLLFYSHGGMSTEPEKSITAVIENTRIIGDAILGAFKASETDEAIIQIIGDFIDARFGFRLEAYELASNVKAYLHYFRKKVPN